MAVPQSKAELLHTIDTQFGKLKEALHAIPPEQVYTPGMEGHAKGTQMSPANLVAYLLGWNELVLKWLQRDADGQSIDFPETGFKWNELGRLAQKFYRDYEVLPWPQLLDRLTAAKAAIVARIEASDDAALYGRPWYGKWTQGRMIQFNTASPYANVRNRLRAWRKGQA
ncbi:ClbS/DfsB family four-helix bundle protein [Acidovorax sp. SDU_ACID1]|uniref:ClbS/DfsB family four-helix bundle protein n=1 Tax=Acidovorax sp. SDU_ACID1 TaxID=3136632 RepID=UPI00387335A6